MAVSRWWQFALGAALGAIVGVYLTVAAFVIAITLGIALAYTGLNRDGDDVMTATAAGFLTGVLGYGLFHVTALVIHAPLQ
jgi:ABC-type dipeptide/oligopeptide/nickel transport system permease subunit